MKNVALLFFCFFFFTTIVQAQIQKGDLSLNGELCGNYTWFEQDIYDYSGSEIGVEFSVAYLLTDHWMVGLGLEEDVIFEGLVPQVRYYINPESERNNYFADLQLGYNFGLEDTRLALSLGFNRFVSEGLSLEAAASYLNYNGERGAVQLGLGLRSFLSSEAYGARRSARSSFGQGSILLGFGDARLIFQEEIFRAGLNFNAGYFLTDRFVAGLRNETNYTNRNGAFALDFTIWENELTGFGRYYLRPAGQRVVPFTELGVGVYGNRARIEQGLNADISRWLAEARLGANVFLSPDIALEVAVAARQESRSQQTTVYFNRDLYPEDRFPTIDGTQTDRNFSLGLHVGLQFFLKSNQR